MPPSPNNTPPSVTQEMYFYHWGVINDAKTRAAKRQESGEFIQREVLVARYQTPLWEIPESRIGYSSVLFKLSDELNNLIEELSTATTGAITAHLTEHRGRPYVEIDFDPGIEDDDGHPVPLIYSMRCRWDQNDSDLILYSHQLGVSQII